jgi:hypothetical protein
MRECKAETREAHQRQPDEHGALSAEARGGGSSRQAAHERSGPVGGDERAGSRLGEVEVVGEVGEQRRECRVEHRVHPDECGDEEQETPHWLPAYFRLTVRV